MENKNKILIGLIALIGISLIITLPYLGEETKKEISNFEECLSAGYQIMESYPRKCQTPEGNIFTENIELPGNRIEILERISANPADFFERQSFLINSEQEWKEVFRGDSGIDFNEYTVIATFLGQRMTGGYSIKISDIFETKGSEIREGTSIKIIVKEIKPGRNCFVTQAITYPYEVVLIPKTSRTLLEIEYKQETYDC